MIGQVNLIQTIDKLIDCNQFPRFSLFIGEGGSGKHMLVDYIKHRLRFDLIEVSTKVDDIRDMINDAYTIQSPTIYVIYDADNMTENAKNAMLKLCEEPTNSAYIIMTLTSESNTLETILSRASPFRLEPYSKDELSRFYCYYCATNPTYETEFISSVCNTPGQIVDYLKYDVNIHEYVELVFDNVDKVSGSNAFKIADKLNLTNDVDFNKVPLYYFFKFFIALCNKNKYENTKKCYDGMLITSKYLSDLKVNSLNKVMLFDNWLLDIRASWLEYAENN